MDTVSTAVLIIATVTMGLTDGVFALYAHTIMPGLAKADDRTFVSAFQSLDRAIMNPWFIGFSFVGALVATTVAAGTQIGYDALPWTVAALVLYSIAFVITIVVHVPLNDALKAAGDPDAIAHLDAVRRDFNEARWRTWNNVRVWATMFAFVSLCWSLVLQGGEL